MRSFLGDNLFIACPVSRGHLYPLALLVGLVLSSKPAAVLKGSSLTRSHLGQNLVKTASGLPGDPDMHSKASQTNSH